MLGTLRRPLAVFAPSDRAGAAIAIAAVSHASTAVGLTAVIVGLRHAIAGSWCAASSPLACFGALAVGASLGDTASAFEGATAALGACLLTGAVSVLAHDAVTGIGGAGAAACAHLGSLAVGAAEGVALAPATVQRPARMVLAGCVAAPYLLAEDRAPAARLGVSPVKLHQLSLLWRPRRTALGGSARPLGPGCGSAGATAEQHEDSPGEPWPHGAGSLHEPMLARILLRKPQGSTHERLQSWTTTTTCFVNSEKAAYR